MHSFGITDYRILAEIDAKHLEGKRSTHPLYDRDALIILGNHVTLDAGTGCVHTAPGHGREDYEVGLQYGLDVYSPVDDKVASPMRWTFSTGSSCSTPTRYQGQVEGNRA